MLCLNQLFVLFGMPSYIHSDQAKTFLSRKFVAFLNNKGVRTNHSSFYNIRENKQIEKFNVTIWTAVKLALKLKNLPIDHWEQVLSEALHLIRSLLCTATNTTPHERLFNYQRRSTMGVTFPTWLSQSGPVLLRRHARSSKHEPVVDKVELMHATPTYAQVRFPTGREATVSLRDIAPITERQVISPEKCSTFEESISPNAKDDKCDNAIETSNPSSILSPSKKNFTADDNLPTNSTTNRLTCNDKDVGVRNDNRHSADPVLRRSTRDRCPPDRLIYYQ